MKLRRVVRSLSDASLKAVVESNDGSLMEIAYNWHTKEGCRAPIPAVWLDAVRMEHAEQSRTRITDLSQIIEP